METYFTQHHHFTELHTNCIVSFGTKAEEEGMAQAWAEEVTENRIKRGLSLLSR